MFRHFGGRGGQRVELLQKIVEVGDPPVFDDLAVANAHGVDGFELDLAARWRDPRTTP